MMWIRWKPSRPTDFVKWHAMRDNSKTFCGRMLFPPDEGQFAMRLEMSEDMRGIHMCATCIRASRNA